jgi:iron complex transport system substrate-binding protein
VSFTAAPSPVAPAPRWTGSHPSTIPLPRIVRPSGLTRPENQRDTEKFSIEISEVQIQQGETGHIFVTCFSGGAERKKTFMENPLRRRLNAVQKGNVHGVDDATWMTSVSLRGVVQAPSSSRRTRSASLVRGQVPHGRAPSSA